MSKVEMTLAYEAGVKDERRRIVSELRGMSRELDELKIQAEHSAKLKLIAEAIEKDEY